MIPLTDVGWQAQSWQWHLSHAVTDIDQLVGILELDGHYRNQSGFPLLVPWPFLSRIGKSDPGDPLLLQVLPRAVEAEQSAGYSRDPLEEKAHSPDRGIIHKYRGRILAIVSGACAINCRYCFRRHFPYEDFQPDSTAWESLFDYVAADATISEVILSGGDPLVLSDRRLAWITSRLERISHVDTLRIHSRLPVVIPGRVCPDLLDWIGGTRLQTVLVIHANHANELDDAVATAMAELRGAGVHLLNQSVLLRNVNDSSETLATLSRRLFEMAVLPYYLHLPDKVTGTAHFDIPEADARALYRRLAAELPGYLLPRLVREKPGEMSKIALTF